jgi:hypothetical protein
MNLLEDHSLPVLTCVSRIVGYEICAYSLFILAGDKTLKRALSSHTLVVSSDSEEKNVLLMTILSYEFDTVSSFTFHGNTVEMLEFVLIEKGKTGLLVTFFVIPFLYQYCLYGNNTEAQY